MTLIKNRKIGVKNNPKYLKVCLINFLVFIGLFTLIEGLASTILMVYKISQVRPMTETVHTEYDELLGWINLPNVSLPNLYGPGVDFKTNSQRFRNNRDFTVEVPPGKLRVICSGDSFTMGWGTSNEENWCHQLTLLDNRLETINMGQGGYGIDQAYLWYERDGVKFDHQVQIFAFINNDFARMHSPTFIGYGKPLLYLENDTLINENYPVPRGSFLVPKLTEGSQYIRELRIVSLWQTLFPKALDTSSNKYILKNPDIVVKILDELGRINREKNSTLIVVYLPTRSDYYLNVSDFWRQRLEPELAKRNIVFVDLIAEFRRRVPNEQVESLFIGGDGHYSVAGNQFVADVLYEKLSTLPAVSQELQE
jgi:hypothetical protein